MLADRIHRFFGEALEKSACKDRSVYQPVDYLIREDTLVNPDLLIGCKPIDGQYLKFTQE